MYVCVLVQVKERKLKDLEKEYPAYLEQLAELEDPVKRLEVWFTINTSHIICKCSYNSMFNFFLVTCLSIQRENKHMGDTIMKLEQENEHLTCELVGSKAGLREEMDKVRRAK